MGGKKIAVLKGTTHRGAARAQLATPPHQRDRGARSATAWKASRCWKPAASTPIAGDKIKLVGLAAQAKDPDKLALLTEDLSFEPYAFALPRNDSAFRLEVNRALTQVYLSGDIETIFAQWLGGLGRPSGLLAAMYLLNAIPE